MNLNRITRWWLLDPDTATPRTHMRQNGNSIGDFLFWTRLYVFYVVYVFKVLHSVYFFFTYSLFSMFYPTHACMLDMDEWLHASQVYLWYIASEYTHMKTSI